MWDFVLSKPEVYWSLCKCAYNGSAYRITVCRLFTVHSAITTAMRAQIYYLAPPAVSNQANCNPLPSVLMMQTVLIKFHNKDKPSLTGRLPIISWCCYKAENDFRMIGTVHVHTTIPTTVRQLSLAKIGIISEQSKHSAPGSCTK